MFSRKKYQTIADNDLPAAFREMRKSLVLEEIYKRFSHLMFGTCLKYLQNKNDAEDCVMDIFQKLPNLLEANEIQYFKSWLYMVTKNECLMRLRKKKNVELPIDLLQIAENDVESTINEKISLEQQIDRLNDAIQSLNGEQKKCIQLFYLEKKCYQEIATQMNLSINKVKSAIQNGKRNLKIKLQEHAIFKSA
ncbi:MAG: sigma-70 family RNA polymerase sigma factor [Crocinitomicaceae bacterium]|nr:sigma-70 family RNA polymerase sigma factor [Crocinitomicaceae bacterium]